MTGVSVYYLIDPRDNRIRYVGKAKNPFARFQRHCRADKDSHHLHVRRWIRQLQFNGLEPLLQIVCWVENDTEAWRYEIALIAILRAKGISLTNISNGGDGRGINYKHTEETKVAISRGIKRSNKPHARNITNYSYEKRSAVGKKMHESGVVAQKISDAWRHRRDLGLKRKPNGSKKSLKH